MPGRKKGGGFNSPAQRPIFQEDYVNRRVSINMVAKYMENCCDVIDTGQDLQCFLRRMFASCCDGVTQSAL